MDRQTFCSLLVGMIAQGVYIGVTVIFDMGNGEKYPRRMQLLNIDDDGTGYSCTVKGYGIARIPYDANFVIQGP